MISVVIPFRGDKGGPREQAFHWCRAYWGAHLPGSEFLWADSGHEPFHRAASINRGVAAAQGNVVIVADADTVVSNVIGLFVALEGTPWVIGYSEEAYYALDAERTARLLDRSPKLRLPPHPPSALGITSWSGVVGFWRDRFIGFDERFTDWGHEDNAFVAAMDTMSGSHARVDGYAFHLHHPRGLEWASPGIKDREALAKRYEAARGDVAAMRALMAEAS